MFEIIRTVWSYWPVMVSAAAFVVLAALAVESRKGN